MKNISNLGKLSLIALIAVTSFAFISSKEENTAEIKWVSFEEAVKLQAKSRKKVIIDVYTDWCGWCKKMDKKTYADKSIIDKINKDYYFVKFNAEQKENVQFRDNTFKFNPDYKSHELAVSLLNGKMSYPATVFLDEDMNLLTVVPGYMEPKDLHPILTYFGDDIYKKANWEEYQGSEEFKKANP